MTTRTRLRRVLSFLPPDAAPTGGAPTIAAPTTCRVALLAVALLAVQAISASAQPHSARPHDEAGASVKTSSDAVRVALVSDPGPAADTLAQQVQAEVERLFAARHTVRFETVGGTSPWTAAAAHDAVQSVKGADAVVVIGPVGAHGVCTANRPSSGSASPNPPLLALSTGSGVLAPASGNDRCTMIGPTGWPSETMRAFQRLQAFESLTVAVDARVAQGIDDAAAHIRTAGRTAGVTARLVTVDPAAPELPAGVARRADAVFLDHADRLPSRAVVRMADALRAEQVPLFTHDVSHTERRGALASPQQMTRLRAREAALALDARLFDTPPAATTGDAASPPPRDARLAINERAAQAVGVRIPLDLRVEARLIGTPAPDASAFTLARSMRESMSRNLELKAKRQRTSASANRIDVARSQLLPQVTASATGRTVNDDLAQSALGSQPERQLTSALSMRQVLFNEPAFAALSVERKMQAMREFERQSVRLDAAQDAASAYLNVLRARARRAIQRENVQTVRTNLDAAQTRRRAGEAGPREVSRLETELAQAERGLVEAMGAERAAEIQFNRVLDRPLDAPVVLDQTAGVDPAPVLDQFPYADLLEQPRTAEAFTSFWVSEARQRAPAVQAVDRLVSARKRELTSAQRAYWMPTLSLEGSLSQEVYEDGAGTSGLTLPTDGSSSFSTPTPPEQQWSLGLTVAFPLFEGTERAAEERQASDALAASRTERMIAQLGVEQSVRTALVELETAYAAVQRAQRAAEAAQHTLDVTEAAYRQGTASLVDLIDAQNSALATRQQASDVAYDLLLDWVNVQRAGGSFAVLRTPEEQEAFRKRLAPFVPAGTTAKSSSME
jgi:outer membrane protein TolC